MGNCIGGNSGRSSSLHQAQLQRSDGGNALETEIASNNLRTKRPAHRNSQLQGLASSGIHQKKSGNNTTKPADLLKTMEQLAGDATDYNHSLYMELSSTMCWDAVKLCATMAGFPLHTCNAQHGLVSQSDRRIDGPEALIHLPTGHAIGFFDNERLIHVMLGTGGGHAAGNKNNCIGIGNSVGWESLNLRNLRWNQNGNVLAPGLLSPERELVVRSRALSVL